MTKRLWAMMIIKACGRFGVAALAALAGYTTIATALAVFAAMPLFGGAEAHAAKLILEFIEAYIPGLATVLKGEAHDDMAL